MSISEHVKGSAVNRASDDTRPPSTSYRETYRRHRTMFRVPVLLGAAVAALILFTASVSYRSTASLWVDTAAPVASSIGADGTPTLSEPPASSEQGILTELLTTASFAQAVAQHSLLGRQLGDAAAIRRDAPTLLEHGQVTAAAAGGQILNVTYTGSTAALTTSVLAGIVSQLRSDTNSLAAQHSAAAIAYDRAQVALDEKALATANANLKAYASRRHSVNRSDPTYLSLAAAQNTAVTQLGQANTTLNQVIGANAAGSWTIRVLDAPSPATSQAPSKKKIAGVILGGALGGALVSFLAVVALTPARTEEPEDEQPRRSSDEANGSGSGDADGPGSGGSSNPPAEEAFGDGAIDEPLPDAVPERRPRVPVPGRSWGGLGHERPLVATVGGRFVLGATSEQMDEV